MMNNFSVGLTGLFLSEENITKIDNSLYSIAMFTPIVITGVVLFIYLIIKNKKAEAK